MRKQLIVKTMLVISMVFIMSAVFGEYAKEDTPLKNGIVIQKGTYYSKYANGKFQKLTLGKNYNSTTGMTIKAGTDMLWYPDGSLQKITLAKTWTDPVDSKPILANTDVYFYTNSNLQKFTIAENWKDPENGMVLKGETEVVFYENGYSKKCTLAKEWVDIDGKVIKPDTEIFWDQLYRLRIFTLARNWNSFKAGQTIFIDTSNKPKIYDPKNDKLE